MYLARWGNSTIMHHILGYLLCFCNVNQLEKEGLIPVRLSEHFITNRGELGPVADNGSIASGLRCNLGAVEFRLVSFASIQ